MVLENNAARVERNIAFTHNPDIFPSIPSTVALAIAESKAPNIFS